MSLGATRNLGNFENIKVELTVEDSVREGEKTPQAMERVYRYVEDELVARVAEMEREIRGR